MPHTQGKWNYRGGTNPHHQGQISSETTGETIAITYNDDGGANARLMAAAPELLTALKECMKDSFTSANGMDAGGSLSLAGQRYKQALAAINNAKEGE